MSTNTQKSSSLPTVITLTLPEKESVEGNGTLLIQRGDLAHIRQFVYSGVSDVAAVIKDAYFALSGVEAEPPVIPETTKATPKSEPKSKGKAAAEPAVEEEPTIDIPLKKGTKTVKISYLKIVGGETDAAAYRQAVMIAGKLIDGKLWDGTVPIRIDDVYTTMKKMKHLTDGEMGLFALEDFVQVGGSNLPQESLADEDEVASSAEETAVETMFVTSSVSPNGGSHLDVESN
ncbi:MAG: hypothetical protein K8L97_22200 [Anaerolineae bacterium]|nr:hypothetical protein [Anaerolineae bacterium]